MKICNDCNIEMIDNCAIEGQHPFEIGVDGRVDMSLHVPTGEQGSILGIKYDKVNKMNVKARYCPQCGKVELYVDLNQKK